MGQGTRQFSNGNRSTQEKSTSVAQPQLDCDRPSTQEEAENEAFHQNRFAAFGLQLKQESGSIAPAEQAKLGALQTKINNFWAERTSRFAHNFAHIPVRASQPPIATSKGIPFAQSAFQARNSPQPIQAKLSVGEPNDRYEQEADQIAAQVVDRLKSASSQSKTIQQQDVNKEDGDKLQMKSLSQSPLSTIPTTPELEAEIGRSLGGGHPLAANIRKPMEHAFGADFSSVKVHTDAQADRFNQLIKSRAFTTGKDIFFRQDAYNPASQNGQKLIAHELTHVVQQTKTLQTSHAKHRNHPYYNSANTVVAPEVQHATPSTRAVFLQRSVFEYPDEDKQFETSSTTADTLGAGSEVKVDCDQNLPTAYGVLAKVYGTDALNADAFTFTRYDIKNDWTRPRSIEAKMTKKKVEARKSPPFVSGVGHLGDTELAIRTGMKVEKESTLSYAGGHLIGDQILGGAGNEGFNLAPQETVNNRNPYSNTIEEALREAQPGTQYTYTVTLKYESNNYEVDQGQLFTHGILTQIQPDKPWKTQIPSRIPNSWTAVAVLAEGQDASKQFKTVPIPTEKTLTEIGQQYYGTPSFSDAPLGPEAKRVWSAYKFRAHTPTGVKKEGDSAGATRLEFHMRQHVPQDKNKRNPAEGERTTGAEATAFGGVSEEAALTLEAVQARLRAVNNYAKGFKERLSDSITQKLEEYLALNTADGYADEIMKNIQNTNDNKISRTKVMREILFPGSMEEDVIDDSEYVQMTSDLIDHLKTKWQHWDDIDVENQENLSQMNLAVNDITDQLELAEKGLLELEEASKVSDSSTSSGGIANVEELSAKTISEELLDPSEKPMELAFVGSSSTSQDDEVGGLAESVRVESGEPLSTDMKDEPQEMEGLGLDPVIDTKVTVPSVTTLQIKQVLDQIFSLIGNLDMKANQLMKRWDATKAEVDEIGTKSVERKSSRARKTPKKEDEGEIKKGKTAPRKKVTSPRKKDD